MSPVIRISDEIFKRLQKLATPLVDTPASVIGKLLDRYENSPSVKTKINNDLKKHINEIKLNPESPGDLSHTKIISARFGIESIKNWKELVIAAHKWAIENTNDFHQVQSISISNISDKELSENGFRFHPEVGFSMQGENANQSWKSALKLAQYFKKEIEISFMWRMNNKATHPGSKGYLYWCPENI